MVSWVIPGVYTHYPECNNAQNVIARNIKRVILGDARKVARFAITNCPDNCPEFFYNSQYHMVFFYSPGMKNTRNVNIWAFLAHSVYIYSFWRPVVWCLIVHLALFFPFFHPKYNVHIDIRHKESSQTSHFWHGVPQSTEECTV
jgi:hypothetical protein